MLTTAAFVVAQMTVCPVSTLPLASKAVAVNCALCPTDPPADAGLTVIFATVLTGPPVTLAFAEALKPWLVAVIVAVPLPTAVANPVVSTVTTDGALLDQDPARRPVSTFPVRVL